MKSKTSKLAFAAVAQFRSVDLRKGTFALCLALCTVGLSLSASAQGPTFTTFDAVGGANTYGSSINPAGASRDRTTRTEITASCALATAPSPPSILRGARSSSST
jgi:hypothetical protein